MTNKETLFFYHLDFFRLGLLLSVVKKTELINWADNQLVAENWGAYNDILADLSLCQETSEKELAALLTTLIGTPCSTIIGSRLLLGRIYALYDLKQTTTYLENFISLMTLSEEEKEEVEEIYFQFNFDSHCYPMTVENIQQAQENALDFLQLYQDYTLQNLEQLATIEAALMSKLLNFPSS